MRAGAALAALMAPAAAAAADLVLPARAERAAARAETFDDHAVATGPFDGTAVPLERVEGATARQVWRVDDWDATTLALLAPTRDALLADGWRILFECAARTCGGFDFRLALDTVPAPAMFVDLADYRYAAFAQGADRLDLVASTSGGVGYLQATVVVPDADAAPVLDARAGAGAAGIGAALDRDGRAVLADLTFPSGSAELTDETAPSLGALAAWLAADPDATVAVVGHTDTAGGTAGNLDLSRRRAEAVRAALLSRHGVAPDRVETRGLAYFAPVASNATPEGRAANRRVEAVVTSEP